MLVGYARVSTTDQTLDLQHDALTKAGCTKIFTDTASGAQTEREAWAELEAIIAHADAEAVGAFGTAVKQAGQASPEGKGMWQDSQFRDLVQYNDGFRTNLIGTPEQIAERIVRLKRLGVNLILCGFLHFQDEVSFFGERVLPLVRQLEHGLSEHEAAPA